MMNLGKLQLTSKQQRIIAVSALITVAIAAVVIVYFVVKKLTRKQQESLKYFAEQDRKFWSGKNELDKAVSSVLLAYWKLAGVNFSEAQMQDPSVQSTYPWSAVYISSLVSRSNFKNFKPRTTHAAYTIDAKKNRQNKLNESFWAYKPSENKKVEVGDILVGNRNGGNYTLDTIVSGAQTHGDIVVGLTSIDGKKYAVVQGGNVGNTVKTSNVLLSDNWQLPQNTSKFAHLKYLK